MCDGGLIRRAGPASSTGGRRRERYTFNRNDLEKGIEGLNEFRGTGNGVTPAGWGERCGDSGQGGAGVSVDLNIATLHAAPEVLEYLANMATASKPSTRPVPLMVWASRIIAPAPSLEQAGLKFCGTLAQALGPLVAFAVEHVLELRINSPAHGSPSLESTRHCLPKAIDLKKRRLEQPHSHSMVAGGFDDTSYATRLIPGTSLITRDEMRSSTSYGNRAQSAVIASSDVTARTTRG